MGKFIDITGNVYSNLTVIRLTDKDHGTNGKVWECLCSCGNTTYVARGRLTSGNTKSCGCLKSSIVIGRNTKHSMSKLPEYKSWKGIKRRLFNPADKRYNNYLSRGITMYEGWIDNFPAFYEHIGPIPSDDTRWTVGRIDNDSGYLPGNVRWETLTQQARNHSRQSNNTTGTTGVTRKTKVVAGVEYKYFVARCEGLDGKRIEKCFSIDKLGEDESYKKACECRKEMINKLNELGAGYADSHGNE